MNKNFTKKSISHEAALEMIKAAFAKAQELEISISVCIVDESGISKVFARMDMAPLISIDVARQKAITAVGWGIPTGQSWHNFIKDDPILFEGVKAIKDFTLLGGGLPIFSNSNLIGAIGVSGGHYAQDIECAEAALNSL